MKPILEVIADAVGDYEGADPVHDRLCAAHILQALKEAGFLVVTPDEWDKQHAVGFRDGHLAALKTR